MNNLFFFDETDSLVHYGTKGMKWGIRQYQYADGTYTPEGLRRYYNSDGRGRWPNGGSGTSTGLGSRIATRVQNTLDRRALNRSTENSDRRINSGSTINRIQTSNTLENHAFYGTHIKDDSDRYLGLFGDNLRKRAKKVGEDVTVYQLDIKTKKYLSIPSDENCVHIMKSLMKDKNFKSDVKQSIKDSMADMKRPQQRRLFKQALSGLNSDNPTMNEQLAIYKAFNLSLTNHNETQVRAQNKFYNEMKKKGYEALLDYNDKEYSSYHAKDPLIIFDMDSVALNSVATPNAKVTRHLNTKYNADRISKDAVKQLKDQVVNLYKTPMENVENYIYQKMEDRLS